MNQTHDNERIKINSKQANLLTEMIQYWQTKQLIDSEISEQLTHSYMVANFNWKIIAKLAFILSIIVSILAISSILWDKVFIKILTKIFITTDITKFFFFAFIASFSIYCGHYLKLKNPNRYYRNQTLYFFGAIAISIAIYFFDKAIDPSPHYPINTFIYAAVIYAVLGIFLTFKPFWLFSLLSFNFWGLSQISDLIHQNFQIMSPRESFLTFIINGIGLVIFAKSIEITAKSIPNSSFFHGCKNSLLKFSPLNKIFGLANLFFGLWHASLIKTSKHLQPVYISNPHLYGLLAIFILSTAALWYGSRKKDAVFHYFGFSFLVITIYTQYFYYFINRLHDTLFFSILAISFWIIGNYAEKIWQFGQFKSNAKMK